MGTHVMHIHICRESTRAYLKIFFLWKNQRSWGCLIVGRMPSRVLHKSACLSHRVFQMRSAHSFSRLIDLFWVFFVVCFRFYFVLFLFGWLGSRYSVEGLASGLWWSSCLYLKYWDCRLMLRRQPEAFLCLCFPCFPAVICTRSFAGVVSDNERFCL